MAERLSTLTHAHCIGLANFFFPLKGYIPQHGNLHVNLVHCNNSIYLKAELCSYNFLLNYRLQ